MSQIERAKASLQATKPRSQRRAVLERNLVHLMVKQLRLENRKERPRPTASRTN